MSHTGEYQVCHHIFLIKLGGEQDEISTNARQVI